MIHQLTLTWPKYGDAVVYAPQECSDVQSYIHNVLTEALGTDVPKASSSMLRAVINANLFNKTESSHLVYDSNKQTLENKPDGIGMGLRGVCDFLIRMDSYNAKLDFYEFRVKLESWWL